MHGVPCVVGWFSVIEKNVVILSAAKDLHPLDRSSVL
jgi:hypothetical protein